MIVRELKALPKRYIKDKNTAYYASERRTGHVLLEAIYGETFI